MNEHQNYSIVIGLGLAKHGPKRDGYCSLTTLQPDPRGGFTVVQIDMNEWQAQVLRDTLTDLLAQEDET